jgi:mRNA-degrading endonuclease RelE of RelBE toxin-antitoxin system
MSSRSAAACSASERIFAVTTVRSSAPADSRALGVRKSSQYRLRVDEIRVFYDVAGSEVEVLAIVLKSEAEQWLEKFGK